MRMLCADVDHAIQLVGYGGPNATTATADVKLDASLSYWLVRPNEALPPPLCHTECLLSIRLVLSAIFVSIVDLLVFLAFCDCFTCITVVVAIFRASVAPVHTL